MVEIKLETADFAQFARDHYISVRVGEAQKLARLTNTRTFKLPSSAIGNRKYGKVELFKRIGSCPVCVDPSAGGANEIEVTFDDTSLHFHAEVSTAGTKPRATKEDLKAVSEEQRRATEYIHEHNLEVRLADAMQQVLRARPADPAQFIAGVLTKRSVSASVLQAPQKAVEPSRVSSSSLASIPEVVEPAAVSREPLASNKEVRRRSSPRKPFVTCFRDEETIEDRAVQLLPCEESHAYQQAAPQPADGLEVRPIPPGIGGLLQNPTQPAGVERRSASTLEAQPISPEVEVFRNARASLTPTCCEQPAGFDPRSAGSEAAAPSGAEPKKVVEKSVVAGEALPYPRRFLPSMGSFQAPSSFGGLLVPQADDTLEQGPLSAASAPPRPGIGPFKEYYVQHFPPTESLAKHSLYSKFTSVKAAALQHDFC